MWACEVVNYRGHRNDRPEGDRVLILEDTNKMELWTHPSTNVYATRLDSALGICVLGNRVLVSAAPYVVEFIDENGDDVPDQKNYVFTKTGDPQTIIAFTALSLVPTTSCTLTLGTQDIDFVIKMATRSKIVGDARSMIQAIHIDKAWHSAAIMTLAIWRF